MPLVFSYGTLQEADVQQSIYGRALQARRDELKGAESRIVTLSDPLAVATTGRARHTNLEFTSGSDSKVSGSVLEMTDADLAKTDSYELLAGYKRIEVVLVSGTKAWAYIYWPSHHQT
jgi:gamma-glutamylcyclotransferase (GGCT)/AIG2-like uncharacterized protein YtfP